MPAIVIGISSSIGFAPWRARNTYQLEPGDSLTFRGDVPHGPERLIKVPIRMLSVIMYADDGER